MASLVDRIDDMLGPDASDLAALDALLADIERSNFKHPGVIALRSKRSRLAKPVMPQPSRRPTVQLDKDDDEDGEEDDDKEGEDSFDMFAPMPSPSSPTRAAEALSPRRGSVALLRRGGSRGRRGSVIMPGGRRGSLMLHSALGSRRGSVMLPPASPTGVALRRGSVMMAPGSLSHEQGSTIQVAGPAGRRASVAIQVEALEALFEPETGGELKSEYSLVFTLALPLVLSNLADNLASFGLIALWGRLGTIALAAGSLSGSWMELGLVVIYGFQQCVPHPSPAYFDLAFSYPCPVSVHVSVQGGVLDGTSGSWCPKHEAGQQHADHVHSLDLRHPADTCRGDVLLPGGDHLDTGLSCWVWLWLR
jgi:hypothetical protein